MHYLTSKGPCVTKGSHSFTCHPHTNRTCLYSPAARHHRPSLAGTNLYCLVTEAHRCEKLAQSFYAACPAESRTHDILIASPTLYRQGHDATPSHPYLFTCEEYMLPCILTNPALLCICNLCNCSSGSSLCPVFVTNKRIHLSPSLNENTAREL